MNDTYRCNGLHNISQWDINMHNIDFDKVALFHVNILTRVNTIFTALNERIMLC